MSLQTAQARAEVRALEAAWKQHKDGCPKCSRRREHCRAGEQVWGQLADARAELKWQRACDKAPAQIVLF